MSKRSHYGSFRPASTKGPRQTARAPVKQALIDPVKCEVCGHEIAKSVSVEVIDFAETTYRCRFDGTCKDHQRDDRLNKLGGGPKWPTS